MEQLDHTYQQMRDQRRDVKESVVSVKTQRKRLESKLENFQEVDVLEDHPQIDIEFHDFVETIESRYDHDKVGVGLRIRPDAREVTPDAMLCPVCVESFRNL